MFAVRQVVEAEQTDVLLDEADGDTVLVGGVLGLVGVGGAQGPVTLCVLAHRGFL